jgi:hypothetical protein
MWSIDPLLSGDSVNSIRFLIMRQLDYNNERAVFSMWSVTRGYKRQEVWSLFGWEFSWVLHEGCEVRTWAIEAEEFPLSEAVARERLVKTQEVGQRLSGCRGGLWIVEISGGAVIACSSSCDFKWTTNPFTNPNPVTSHVTIITPIAPARNDIQRYCTIIIAGMIRIRGSVF